MSLHTGSSVGCYEAHGRDGQSSRSLGGLEAGLSLVGWVLLRQEGAREESQGRLLKAGPCLRQHWPSPHGEGERWVLKGGCDLELQLPALTRAPCTQDVPWWPGAQQSGWMSI